MKILIIASRIPKIYKSKGDQIRAYRRLAKFIEKGWEVKVIYYELPFQKRDHQKEGILQHENLTYLPIKLNLLQLLNSFFKNLKKLPIQVAIFKSKKGENILKKTIQNFSPDITLSIVSRSCADLCSLKIPYCLDLIDSLSLNMLRRSEKSNWLSKKFFKLESDKLFSFEKKLVQNSELCWITSDIDREYLKETKIKLSPVAIDIFKYKIESKKNPYKIIFSGNLNYAPNIDALNWLLDNCWDQVLLENKNAILHVVGRGANQTLIKKIHSHKSTLFCGEVNDMNEYIKDAAISIAPMQSGSGMQLKILEAMRLGIPVITNQLGRGDIRAKNNEEILLADKPQDFAKKICCLLSNKNLRESLGLKGKLFVEKQHNAKLNSMNFYDDIMGLIKTNYFE